MPESAPLPLPVAASAGDEVAMAALRVSALSLADGSDWSRCDDHEVVAQVAVAVARGRLRGGQVAVAAKLFRLAPVLAPQAAPAPALAPSPRAAPAAVAAAAETTFNSLLDTAAMVAALRQAAQDGVPFCEECERARLAREAA